MSVRCTLEVRPTQNTAPVLEFNCLYTHDIRRKQKRWQDGFLRFHTFNKRIMVYDVPRNLVGDAHWNAEELQDGDEVTLEKGGVLVQVAEMVGRTDTDLTELFKSKKKMPNAATSSSPMRASTHQVQPCQFNHLTRQVSAHIVQPKHRSLNALLQTPRGRIGKAVLPTKSPFEERREAENAPWDSGRPAKRRRVEPTSVVEQPFKRPREPAQRHQRPKDLVDLSSQSSHHNPFLAGFSDDALASPRSSPLRRADGPNTPAPIRSSSPAFQRQRTPENEMMVRRAARSNPQAATSATVPMARSSPTDFAFDTIGAIAELECGPAQEDRSREIFRSRQTTNPAAETVFQPLVHRKDRDSSSTEVPRPPISCDKRPENEQRELARTTDHPSRQSGRTLRMAAGAPKRKTLLCQNQLSSKSSHSLDSGYAIVVEPSKQVVSPHIGGISQHYQLQQRLARIGKNAQRSTEKTSKASEQPEANATNAGQADGLLSLHALSNAQPAQPCTTAIGTNSHRSRETALNRSPKPRQLRRVVSESNHAGDGSSERTSQLVMESQQPLSKDSCGKDVDNQAAGGVLTMNGRLKSRQKKPLNRAASLNLASNGTSTVILSRKFQLPNPPQVNAAVPDVVANPWSREAFDLFTWRPPGWDEGDWCVKAVEQVAVEEA